MSLLNWVVQIKILHIVLAIAVFGSISIRAIENRVYKGDNDNVKLLLRAVVLAIVSVITLLIFGSKIGSIQHHAEMAGKGFGQTAGFPLNSGPAPF